MSRISYENSEILEDSMNTCNDLQITKFEHDTVLIHQESSNITVVFDPFQVQGALRTQKRADVIFITHDHFDHFSPKDIHSLTTRETIFVFPASILDKLQTFLDVPEDRLVPVVPLEEYVLTVKGSHVKAMAVPAYNIDKKSPQGNLYHPKEKEFVGFLVELNGTSVYFVGDSDPIPEMDVLVGMVDVLVIPVSGLYVMTVEEAIQVTQKLQPRWAMPVHYGSVVGDVTLGERFLQEIQQIAPDTEVIL